MIEITADIYRLVAARLRDRIAASDWFNGTVRGVLPTDGNEAGTGGADISAEWSLTLTAIVCRRAEMFPEGVRRPISDIVPVWWEFSTADEHGQCLNDFTFSELRPFVIDYD